MANTDLRVKRIISPRSGSVYIPVRCPPFTRCLSSLCYEPGSGRGSGGQQDKSSPVLPMRTPEPVGKSGVSTDNCEALWERLLGPEKWGTCVSPGWGGVASTGVGSWGECCGLSGRGGPDQLEMQTRVRLYLVLPSRREAIECHLACSSEIK